MCLDGGGRPVCGPDRGAGDRDIVEQKILAMETGSAEVNRACSKLGFASFHQGDRYVMTL